MSIHSKRIHPVEPVSQVGNARSEMDRFIKKDPTLKSSAVAIQNIFNKAVQSKETTPEEREAFIGRVNQFYDEIERQEKESWFSTTAYRMGSAACNFFRGNRSSSHAIAKQMQATLAESLECSKKATKTKRGQVVRDCIQKFSKEQDFTKVPENLQRHPFACSRTTLSDDYAVIGQEGKKEIKIRENPFNRFKAPGLNEKGELSESLLQDIVRTSWTFSGEDGPIEFPHKESAEDGYLVVNHLKGMGLNKEKVGALCQMLDQGLVADIIRYPSAAKELGGQTDAILAQVVKRGYTIIEEEGSLVIKADLTLESRVKGELKIGSQDLSMEIRLPLEKMKHTEPLEVGDFKVKHTYGPFQLYRREDLHKIPLKSITSKVEKFKEGKSWFPPSTGKMQHLFSRVIEGMQKAPKNKAQLLREISVLKDHIEEKERCTWFPPFLYRVASATYEFFCSIFRGEVPSFKSSHTVVMEMLGKRERERVIKAAIEGFQEAGTSNNPEGLRGHPFTCKEVTLTSDYTVGGIEVKVQEEPYEMFTGKGKEDAIKTDPSDTGLSVLEEYTGDVVRSVIAVEETTLPNLGIQDKLPYTKALIQNLQGLGLADEKIPSFFNLLGLNLTADLCHFTNSVHAYQEGEHPLVVKSPNPECFIYKEGGRLIFRREMNQYAQIADTVIGKFPIEMKISLPLDKMQSKEAQITQEDFEVTHTYGAFEPGYFVMPE